MNSSVATESNPNVRIVSNTAILRAEVHRLLTGELFNEPPHQKANGRDILLTGATGFIGTAVLGRLLADSRGWTVHCLVRAESEEAGFARLRACLQKAGRWEECFASRLRAVPGDLAQPKLGLSDETILSLRHCVSDIIHSAAHLNFIATYKSVRVENVDATLALVEEFCAPAGIHLHHVSSVGIMTGDGFPDELPETRSYLDEDVELIGGYSQTKWVADQALFQLQQRGWPISILRPAHVNDRLGSYPELSPLVEFFFTLLRSGQAPVIEFQFYYTPLEEFAEGVVAILSAPDELRTTCHHFASEPVPYAEVVEQLKRRGKTFEHPPLEVWRGLMKKACLENAWDFTSMIPYVYYMTESRLRLGHVRCDQAAKLGWKPPTGCRWDAEAFTHYVLSVFPSMEMKQAAEDQVVPTVAKLPESGVSMDIYDLDGMRGLAYELGGAFTVRYKGRDVVVVTDADLARHILVDQFLDYQKGKGMMGQFGEVLGRGLFTSDGDDWARDRKLLSPLFQSKLMERFDQLFHTHTTAFVEELGARIGHPVEVHPLVSRYSLQLAAECFFSVRSVDDFPFQAIDDLKYLVKEFRQDLRSIPRETFGRVQASYKAFRAYVNTLIAERRATSGTHYDVFEHFAKDGTLSDDEVFGQVSSLIAAAYDTTNVSLSFILKLLSIHPEEQDAIREEVSALAEPVRMQDLMKLRRTRAFIDETLRLYPPVWAIPRFSVAAHQACGFDLPQDRDYLIYTYLIHRSPRYWSDPDKFRPERFSGSSAEPSNKSAYHPFSLGKRTCIGMGFALYEMLHLVAHLLRSYRVLAVDQPFTVEPLYPVIGTTEPMRITLEKLC